MGFAKGLPPGPYEDHKRPNQRWLLSKDESINAIDRYQTFTDHYLGAIKEMATSFRIQNISDAIIKYLEDHRYQITIKTIKNTSDEEVYEGRGRHIQPILIGLIENSMDRDQKGSLKLMSKVLKNIRTRLLLLIF